MPRFSVSLSDEQHDWLEDEADRRNRSKADVVRACITAVKTGSVKSEPDQTGAVRTDVVNDLEDRLAQLEARVGDLEPEEPVTTEYRETEPIEEPDPPGSKGGGNVLETTTQNGDVIEEALGEWGKGRNEDEEQPRRESAEAVVRWLRGQPGEVKKRDVINELYDDHGVEDVTVESWWTETARDALQHAAKRGYVRDTGYTYEWLGE